MSDFDISSYVYVCYPTPAGSIGSFAIAKGLVYRRQDRETFIIKMEDGGRGFFRRDNLAKTYEDAEQLAPKLHAKQKKLLGLD